MKRKLFFFLIAPVGAILGLFASCGPQRASQQTKVPASEKNTTGPTYSLMTQDALLTLGIEHYLSDGFQKNIHVMNSKDVMFTPVDPNTGNEAKLENGAVRVTTSTNKTMGILRANTAGEIDSIARYDTKRVWKYKVKYIVENVGPYYIWFYRKKDVNGTYYYACNDNQIVVINGVTMKRTTYDNRLLWDYGLSTKSSSNTFNVVSPFGGTTGQTNATKKDEEEEKEND